MLAASCNSFTDHKFADFTQAMTRDKLDAVALIFHLDFNGNKYIAQYTANWFS